MSAATSPTADLCFAQAKDRGRNVDAHDAGRLGYSSGNLGHGIRDEGVLSSDDFSSAGRGGV